METSQGYNMYIAIYIREISYVHLSKRCTDDMGHHCTQKHKYMSANGSQLDIVRLYRKFPDMDPRTCYERKHDLKDSLSSMNTLAYTLHMDFQYNRVNTDRLRFCFALCK